MGKVRLIQGDCLSVLRRFKDETFDAIITDPPYGIDYQSKLRLKGRRMEKIIGDKYPFIWWIHDAYRVLKPNGGLLCFCRWDVEEAFRQAITYSGFRVMSQVIWDKCFHGAGDTKRMFAPQHENIIFAVKKGFKFPGKRPRSVLRNEKILGQKLLHPTEKPVSLMTRLCQSITSPGGLVLDPFMGSGSTGVACVLSGREFSGIEVNEDYFRTAKKRIWKAFRVREKERQKEITEEQK